MQNVLRIFEWAVVIAEVWVALRALLHPHKEPGARLAWLLAIVIAPGLGSIFYLLLGEARLSRRRRARAVAVDSSLPRPPGDPEVAKALGLGRFAAPFALARSVNGLAPTGGNRATLLADSNAAVDGMIADIDAARETVHLCFYIWLADHNGLKLKEALLRAAARGVKVRVLADALGSRGFIRSPHWVELIAGRVDCRVALPVGNLLWTMIRGRVDLRNHRKLMVVDSAICWCGSQNLADPEFLIKRKYAPWVDIMTRWQGPVARQWQFLFTSDWIAEGGDDITPLLLELPDFPPIAGGIPAQVIGTGPSRPYAIMAACFSELIHAARAELVISTPYFVPDEQLLAALVSAGRRGVMVTLILPRRNDSRIIAAASRSYYRDLLKAGVAIHEYEPGLLHAKTMVADGEVALIGSANLDRRSFELNFENNLLFADPDFACAIRARQSQWLAQSTRIGLERVDGFTIPSRLWQNVLAMVSPLI